MHRELELLVRAGLTAGGGTDRGHEHGPAETFG